MRILFVTPYFYPAQAFGGPVKVVFDVGRKLVRRGHEVFVYTSDAKDLKNRINVKSDEIEGITVFYLRNLSMFLVKKSKLFITPKLVKKMKWDLKSFDIIHAHEFRTYQNMIVHKFAKEFRVPYILQSHGSLPRIERATRKRLYDFFIGQKILRDASKVIALSSVEAKQYTDMSVPKEKIAIIPNGIDFSDYAILPPKGCFKKKFNIPEDKKIILYLGRVHKSKGIEFLIKAYAYLVKNMNGNDTRLVIAGPDDGYLFEASQLAKYLKISDKVVFTGFLSEKEKISAYVDSNIVVNVEPNNVFGLVPIEAAACSTPVIVSKTNAIFETVSKGNFGYSVKYGDINDLEQIMSMMLNNDDLLRKLGQNGRNFVFKNIGWNNIIIELEKIYKAVTVPC